MANIAAFAQKQVLDFLLGGGSGTIPASRYVALCTGTPTSVVAGEVNTNSGYFRQTVLFGPAASPAGSASNTAAMTFGPFSSSAAIQGIAIFNTGTGAGTVGSMLWYGTLATARTVGFGDTITIAVGDLIVTLS